MTAHFCEGCGATVATGGRFCGTCGQVVADCHVEPEPSVTTVGPSAQAWGLERFAMAGVLGEGGSGTVYLAYDAVSQRDVAVKILGPSLAASADYVDGFFAQAATLARLHHPNVVTIVDQGQTDGHAWVATEYVSGASLRQLLARHSPMTTAQALGVLRGALEGLAAVHRAGLLHGDISPANILIDQAGVAKLTDFGSSVGSSTDGHGVTPAYASPEAAQNVPVDARSDLYSMGVVLYECLAGRAPFEGPPELVLQHQVITDVPRIDGLETSLQGVLNRALAKDPSQRMESAEAFLAALEGAAVEADGTDWKERASVVALVGMIGAEAGVLLGPALGASGSRPPPVAQALSGTAAHASHHGGAMVGALGGNAPLSKPIPAGPSILRRVANAVMSHKAAAATTAAVVTGAGLGTGLAVQHHSSPATPTTKSVRTTTPSTQSALPPDRIPDPAGGSWAPPVQVDKTGSLSAISCTSSTFCFAIDSVGSFFTYNGQEWSRSAVIDPSANRVSTDPSAVETNFISASALTCPEGGLCMIAAGADVVTYDRGSWNSAFVETDDLSSLSALSCASATFCVAGDAQGRALVFNGTSWSAPTQVDQSSGVQTSIESMSCPTSEFCMAVDDQGQSLAYRGGTWSTPVAVRQDGSAPYLASVSCSDPTSCVAVSAGGYAYAFNGQGWSAPMNVTGGRSVNNAVISCATARFCKAVYPTVGLSTYDGSTWSRVSGLGTDSLSAAFNSINALSCPRTSFCMAVSNGGDGERFYGPS